MTSINGLRLSNEESRSSDALARLSATLEPLGAQEIVNWSVKQYATGLVLASSFSAEDMVLIDMLTRATDHPTIFYLDTGLLFPETHKLIGIAEARYHFEAVRVAPTLTLEAQRLDHGDALWSRQPDLCCHFRKVAPLMNYLQDKSAWITGIRRDQTLLRRESPVVGYDIRHDLIKINPLAAWSYQDVFRYLVRHQVPYNPLHDHGYPSIGCVPCTQAVASDEDPRAGRWAGQEKTECGLHL